MIRLKDGLAITLFVVFKERYNADAASKYSQETIGTQEPVTYYPYLCHVSKLLTEDGDTRMVLTSNDAAIISTDLWGFKESSHVYNSCLSLF